MKPISKDDISLVEIAEKEGVELQEHGNLYRGRCPFHRDKDPSFFIYEENRFKCFGCGAAGDVVTFVQKIRGISFPRAMKYLGLPMRDRDKVKNQDKEAKDKEAKDTKTMLEGKTMLEIIEDEEWMGIDVKKRYGERFIGILLMNEIKRLSRL
jgi:DNA primase